MIHAALHIWWLWAALFAAWRADINLNPFRPCPRCKGSDRGRFSRARAYGRCAHGPRERVRFTGGLAAARQERRRQG
jgi:hypothetical protein